MSIINMHPITGPSSQIPWTSPLSAPTCQRVNPWGDAIKNNDIDAVEALIAQGADINLPNPEGITPLMYSIITGNKSKTSILLRKGANKEAQNRDGKTALMLAIERGLYYDSVKLFDSTIKDTQDKEGNTPLILSIRTFSIYKDTRIPRFLIQNDVDVNIADAGGNTALMHAAKLSDPYLLESLLYAGADKDKQNKQGKTALMLALSAMLYNPEIYENPQKQRDACSCIEKLLNAGADVNVMDNNGVTAFKMAVWKNDNWAVRMLLNKGAKSCGLIREKSLAYHLARGKGSYFLKSEQEEIFKRVGAAHAFNVGGTTSLQEKGYLLKQTVKLEGGNSKVWEKLISQFLGEHRKSSSLALMPSDIRRLRQTLNYATDDDKHPPEKTLKRIKQGKPVILNSGWKEPKGGHAVNILIWNDLFFLCNRGAATRKPIEAYRFNPENLTEAHIIHIQPDTLNGQSQYKEYMFTRLQRELDFQKDTTTSLLEKSSLPPFQTVGNCSWASLVTVINTWMYANRLHYDITGEKRATPLSYEEVKHMVMLENRHFLELLTSINLQFLKILTPTPESQSDEKYEIDHRLVKISLIRAAVFGNMSEATKEQLDELITKYKSRLSLGKRFTFDARFRTSSIVNAMTPEIPESLVLIMNAMDNLIPEAWGPTIDKIEKAIRELLPDL